MEAPSPARLYAAAVGVLLVAVGIAGFFYTASFGAPGDVAPALGVLRVNGWMNLLHLLAGAAGLLAAGVASRGYALAVGILFTVLGVWGLTLGSDAAILGFLPAAGGDEALHLVLGLLGLAAAAATPRRAAPRPAAPSRTSKRKRSETGAKPAGEGA
ncbi:MAG: DUF4383 domain-containing protein [Syntrophothermus sp.]